MILTKMDGDTRGGAALSVKAVTGKPIKFVGVGEKLTDIEPFYPDRMASRILGMGDMLSLIEKAEEAFRREESPGDAAEDALGPAESKRFSRADAADEEHGLYAGYSGDAPGRKQAGGHERG